MSELRTAFTGYYGMRNFGDDLFGVIATRAAQRYWRARPLLVGPALAGMAGSSTVPALYPTRWYGGAGSLGKGSRLLSFARGTLQSDVLVMGGGSVITARESFRKPMMQAARRHRGLRLAAVGVSIGPFANEQQEVQAASFLQRFSYLSVRDARSHAWTQRMGLSTQTHAGCDLAALLLELAPPPPRVARGGDAPFRLGIAPCRYREDGDYAAPSRQAWHTAFVEAAQRHAAQRPLAVEVFSLNEHPRHGDTALAHEICERLHAAGIEANLHRYAQPDPLAMVARIAACDALVSARLHGAIVAFLAGVPFAIVDYHRKCRDFADDIGLPPRRRITAGGEAFSDVIDSLLAGGDGARSSPQVYARQAKGIFESAPWAPQAEA